MEPSNLTQFILDSQTDPAVLESLYRRDPAAFQKSFQHAIQQQPNSIVLSVWNARLTAENTSQPPQTNMGFTNALVAGGFASMAAVITRLALVWVLDETNSPVNLLLGIATAMIGFFLYNNRASRKLSAVILGCLAAIALYINLLPFNGKDAVILANLHLPIVIWVLAGAAFTGNQFRQTGARLAFLRFNGEFAILFAVMAISGIVLTGVTLRLFSLIGLDIAEFYFTNIVTTGAAFLAVIAAFMVSNQYVLAKNMAPYIAKIFSPLVLLTLLVFLVSVVVVGLDPFIDRDFLLIFNVVLVAVLAVIIFSITERAEQESRTIFDWASFALIFLALATDLTALFAIVFRLSAYGLTPNRLAVLGANIVILVHLAWILWVFYRFLRNEQGVTILQQAATQYLPVYGGWGLIVAISFPLVFGF